MSSSERKIGFYTLQFKAKGKNVYSFDADVFCCLLDYIQSQDPAEKIMRDNTRNKAYTLESYSRETLRNGKTIIKIIMQSCKYNHSPAYLSSTTGEISPSTKQLNQGENERTHLVGRVDDDELYFALELRQSGTAVSLIIKYLNYYLKKMEDEDPKLGKFKVTYFIVSLDNFEELFRNLQKATSLTVTYDKRLLDTPALQYMRRNDITMQDNIEVTLKAKPKEAISERIISELGRRLLSKNSEIRRLRIRGKDSEANPVVLDSALTRKTLTVHAEISEEDGTIDSNSIFKKMIPLIKSNEEQ